MPLKDVKLGKDVVIPFPDLVNIYGCEILDNCFIGPFVEIQKDVKICERCSVQSHTFICSKVEIGRGVFIGHGVAFINDRYPVHSNPEDWEGTIVEDGVVVGSNATILPCVIGKNAIVGAGAVVTKNIPPNKKVVGNPAKLIGIPFQNLRQEYSNLKGEIDSAVASVLESGHYILGDNVAAFEHEFATYCGVKNGIGVASGTDALTLALAALDIGRGDEVITVPNTYIATADAIAHNNATPVFVNINLTSYTIDPAAIKAAITNRTKAIIPVHLYGHPADMQPIMEIAADHDLFVIEDACQAHGAEYRGNKAGSLGDIAAFSFYPTKNLGCCGDGGMVVTDIEDIADNIRKLRNYGQRKKHEHVYIGYNSRLDELQAAILRVKLKHLDQWITNRRTIASLYDKLLPPNVLKPYVSPIAKHAYHLYVIQTEKRDKMQQNLRAQGIETAIHYPTPIHQQIAYNYLGYFAGAFPHVESIAKRILSLPMHPYLELQEIEYIAEEVRKAS